MSIQPAAQQSLFESKSEEGGGVVALAVPGTAKTLSKSQREFNRLSGQVRRQREELQAWEAYKSRFQQRLAGELHPALSDLRAAQRALILRMHALLTRPAAKGERLSRRHQSILREQIGEILEDVLSEGEDAELEVLAATYDALTPEERRRMDLELAQEMIGEVFGADKVEGHEAEDIESLLKHVQEKVASQAEQEQRRREEQAAKRAARRGRPTKAELAAERKALAAREAGQSVREIYRKLASALHPDREVDPAERQRKTLLMQRTNDAYERRDLLALLSLQIEVEQIDLDHMAGVPEERIRHYNEVLREQLHSLKEQVLDSAAPILMSLGLGPVACSPTMADAALTRQIGEVRQTQCHIEHDLKCIDDPKSRRALLDDMAARQDDDFDFDPFDALLEGMFQVAPSEAQPKPKRGGRKRRG
ncbi:MAG TPA: hypothetical protein VFP68_16510 [Burkholderiaceae bacterium]|nr:hypothetical protein [Burkholderiaceae bacterium]